MSMVSQIAGMTILSSIPGSISPTETMLCSQDSLRSRRRFARRKCAFRPECRLVCMRPCGAENVVTWQAQSHSAKTISGFCPTPSSVLIPVFTRSPVRGISVALRHSVFCFASRPHGFRFHPKQIRSKTGTEHRANFFRFPPKKQTFGTWEPGPLPWLRHL
jgi:hypothetical protein